MRNVVFLTRHVQSIPIAQINWETLQNSYEKQWSLVCPGLKFNHSSPETRGFILVALARVNASNYIKPIDRVYTRECHENKTTRFWATMV